MAWGVITFLIVPVVMFDDLGPVAGLKRSGQLLRTSWKAPHSPSGGLACSLSR